MTQQPVPLRRGAPRSAPTFTAHVAAEIRAHLARQGKQKKQLARALGIDPSGVSTRLAGKVPFDTEELETAARFLELPLSAFLDWTPPDGEGQLPRGDSNTQPADNAQRQAQALALAA